MNFSLLQKGELVMIRRAIDRDASRIAEISVLSLIHIWLLFTMFATGMKKILKHDLLGS